MVPPGIVGMALATTLRPGLPLAQEATPASDAMFDLGLTQGTAPTIFGEVVLPQDPQRIVTLTDGALDAAIALGVTPVGITRSSNDEGAATYLADKVPDDVAYIGGWEAIDIEKILLLQPDLILADRYLYPEEYEPLSAIAPVVAPEEIAVPDADALQQWEYEHLVWGHALGRYDEAVALVQEFRDRAAAFKAALGDKTGQSVIVFRAQEDFPVLMSHQWITGRVLAWAGFPGNALTEEMPPPHSARGISLEQLHLLDTDWLFAAARTAADARVLEEQYMQDPLFRTLPAVQAGQVALVNGDLWSGTTGVLAAHAMLDEIEAIVVRGEGVATPAA